MGGRGSSHCRAVLKVPVAIRFYYYQETNEQPGYLPANAAGAGQVIIPPTLRVGLKGVSTFQDGGENHCGWRWRVDLLFEEKNS
jgi:hypothetical protein